MAGEETRPHRWFVKQEGGDEPQGDGITQLLRDSSARTAVFEPTHGLGCVLLDAGCRGLPPVRDMFTRLTLTSRKTERTTEAR